MSAEKTEVDWICDELMVKNMVGEKETAKGLAKDLAKEVRRLRDLATNAIDLAEEGWSYASDYFREKYYVSDQVLRLREALTAPTQAKGEQ